MSLNSHEDGMIYEVFSKMIGNCNLHLRFVISTFWFRMGAWSFQDGCLAPMAPVPTGGLPTNDPKQIIKFSY